MKLRLHVALVLSPGGLGCASPTTAEKVKAAEARKTRPKLAEARFQERYKNAGESINRTVDDVEGVFLFADVSIKNEDVGFVQIGQSAQLKIQAYPFQKYGIFGASAVQLMREKR
jgi:hypothetical protein